LLGGGQPRVSPFMRGWTQLFTLAGLPKRPRKPHHRFLQEIFQRLTMTLPPLISKALPNTWNLKAAVWFYLVIIPRAPNQAGFAPPGWWCSGDGLAEVLQKYLASLLTA
jgi:hypothetical protein